MVEGRIWAESVGHVEVLATANHTIGPALICSEGAVETEAFRA